MNTRRTRGFTLIELLTVVAIIAILASMIFIIGPGIILRARLASLKNSNNQIRTALVAYMTKGTNSSYPPAYGFKRIPAQAFPSPPPAYNNQYFISGPYLSFIQLFGNKDLLDPFGQTSYDTDGDGQISRLEFLPIGTEISPGKFQFPTEIYRGNNAFPPGETTQMTAKRPLAYIPVNLDQARKVAEYYRLLINAGRTDDGLYARCWNPNEALAPNPLATLQFPPAKLDDFVLISVGPGGNMGGLLTAPNDPFMQSLMANVPTEEDWYHILALRAYYLAKRDVDPNDPKKPGNGMVDFDYQSRRGEDRVFVLPNGTNGYGPVIYQPSSGQGYEKPK